MNDPTTPAQWQEAADAAHFMLSLEAARQYGLVEGGPGVDAPRCEFILAEAAARGILPHGIDSMEVGL